MNTCMCPKEKAVYVQMQILQNFPAAQQMSKPILPQSLLLGLSKFQLTKTHLSENLTYCFDTPFEHTLRILFGISKAGYYTSSTYGMSLHAFCSDRAKFSNFTCAKLKVYIQAYIHLRLRQQYLHAGAKHYRHICHVHAVICSIKFPTLCTDRKSQEAGSGHRRQP